MVWEMANDVHVKQGLSTYSSPGPEFSVELAAGINREVCYLLQWHFRPIQQVTDEHLARPLT